MFCGSVCCCFCRSLSRLSSEYWDSCCSNDMLSITIGCRTLQILQICMFPFHIYTIDTLHKSTCFIIRAPFVFQIKLQDKKKKSSNPLPIKVRLMLGSFNTRFWRIWRAGKAFLRRYTLLCRDGQIANPGGPEQGNYVSGLSVSHSQLAGNKQVLKPVDIMINWILLSALFCVHTLVHRNQWLASVSVIVKGTWVCHPSFPPIENGLFCFLDAQPKNLRFH